MEPSHTPATIPYTAVIGWGLTIYAIFFLLWSLFISYGFIAGAGPQLASALVLILLLRAATRAVAPQGARMKSILPYSVGWLVVIMILDTIMSVPFSGWEMFLNPTLWFGYALIVFVPVVYARVWHYRYKKQSSSAQ
jgi:hypothetical protein